MWEHFYNGVTRKYIIMFGNMFNDINVVRYGKDGNPYQTIRVPIAYGPRESYLARMRSDSGLDKEVAIQLPRLSFELITMQYAPDRALNKMHKVTAVNSDPKYVTSQYTPIPYDITMSLYGYFANNEDAVQTNEQILPFFRPEWTQSLNLVPEIGEYYDVPTVLSDLQIEDTYENDFITRRAIIYTWNFTIKGWLFGPTSNKGIIKRSVVDMAINSTGESIGTEVGPDKKVVLTPGLTANGQPTANSAASVSHLNVNSDDNYGYAFDSFDYFDGKNRHDH